MKHWLEFVLIEQYNTKGHQYQLIEKGFSDQENREAPAKYKHRAIPCC